MGWYKRTRKNSKIEHFSRELLNELIPFIKNKSQTILGIQKAYFSNIFSNINNIFLDLSFNKDKTNNYMTNNVSVAGKTIKGLNNSFLIKIVIYLSENANNNINPYLSKIYFDTLSIIRHELEHLNQHNFNKNVKNYISDNFDYNSKQFPLHLKSYYLQQSEKPAFISGLYLKAKKQRKSFSLILEQSLISEIEKALFLHYSRYLNKEKASHLASQEAQSIKEEFLKEAKKRYQNIE